MSRALAARPDDRYRTASEMSDALTRYVEEDGRREEGAALSSYMRKLFRDDYLREAARIKTYISGAVPATNDRSPNEAAKRAASRDGVSDATAVAPSFIQPGRDSHDQDQTYRQPQVGGARTPEPYRRPEQTMLLSASDSPTDEEAAIPAPMGRDASDARFGDRAAAGFGTNLIPAGVHDNATEIGAEAGSGIPATVIHRESAPRRAISPTIVASGPPRERSDPAARPLTSTTTRHSRERLLTSGEILVLLIAAIVGAGIVVGSYFYVASIPLEAPRAPETSQHP